MNFKKVLAGMAAASVAVSMLSASTVSAAKTGDTAIDFEDGDISFIEMYVGDGGDASKLSVVDYNGSKQLKIELTKVSASSKVQVNLKNMIAPEDLAKISKIEASISFASIDGTTPVAYHGGQVGTNSSDSKPAWDASNFKIDEAEFAKTSFTFTASRLLPLPTSQFKADSTDPTVHFQTWSGDDVIPYDWYIDDIKFLDAEGNLIPLTVSAADASTDASAAKEDTAVEETTAGDVAASDAVASDTSATKSPVTGNNASAAAIAVVMLGAAGVAVITKRK